MSSSLNERLEQYSHLNEERKNATEKNLLLKPPRLVRPRFLRFKEERGYIHYIAIGAASALLCKVNFQVLYSLKCY